MGFIAVQPPLFPAVFLMDMHADCKKRIVHRFGPTSMDPRELMIINQYNCTLKSSLPDIGSM